LKKVFLKLFQKIKFDLEIASKKIFAGKFVAKTLVDFFSSIYNYLNRDACARHAKTIF